MPYQDEEYPGQPLWQSVLLFCCRGMIEGIMVLLFFWLLVQILFTKQLEVHLQALLLVGLIIFCLTLLLGCVMCWKTNRICSGKDKAPTISVQHPVDEAVTSSQDGHPSGASRQLYDELDGDTLEYPSTFTSPAPSQSKVFSQPFSDQTVPPCEESEQATSYFSLRRFSSPLQTAPLYKPIHPSRASLPSLPSLPKLGLLTKTCKAMQRRCPVTGDNGSHSEHSRLTNSQVMPGNLIPLTLLGYGSNADCKLSFSSKPCLHFTMAFSAEQQTLTVTVLNLTGAPQKLEDVTVLGSLPPLHAGPTPATALTGLSLESSSPALTLNVSSVDELQGCELRLAVHEQETLSTKGTALGEVEVKCGGRDWRSEQPFHLMRELTSKKLSTDESLQHLTSQDALRCQGLHSPPRIFIGLQYQPRTHSVKATVFRGDNLHSLFRTSVTADYKVLINVYHEGVLISGRETFRESCTVWNDCSFLFDLPPGDVSQLPLCLEFVIMQNQMFSDCRAVGRVLVGSEAADAGRAHWTDMCSLQAEQARWHTVQPERPFNT